MVRRIVVETAKEMQAAPPIACVKTESRMFREYEDFVGEICLSESIYIVKVEPLNQYFRNRGEAPGL